MSDPNITTIAKLFCPFRAEQEPTALSIVQAAALVAHGGASRLSELLMTQTVHPVLRDTTTKLQYKFTEASRFDEITTRASGTVGQAIMAMCERSGLLYVDVFEIAQAQQGWVGPIAYHNHWAASGRVAGDLTMYLY
jgi:hypothetical protein